MRFFCSVLILLISLTIISASAAKTSSKEVKQDKHGFIVGDPDAALSLAVKEKRPLLIEFSTIWCPPCNQLEEVILSNPQFIKASRRFVKLKLDGDNKSSWTLKERYRVYSYPTIVFTTDSGDEIFRVSGMRKLDEFLSIVKEVIKYEHEPLGVLRSKVDAGDVRSAKKLADLYLERSQFAEAKRYYELYQQKLPTSEFTESDRIKFESAIIGIAKVAYDQAVDDQSSPEIREASVKEYLDKVLVSVKKYPNTAEAVEWIASFNYYTAAESKDKTVIDQLSQHTIKAGEYLIADPNSLKGKSLTIADVHKWMGIAYKQMGDEKSSQAAHIAAAKEYERMLQTHQLSVDKERGYNLEIAANLGLGGKVEEAITLYKKLEHVYPNEYTFYYKHAALLRKQKDYKRAEELAKLALTNSYGINRIWSYGLLINIMKESGKIEEAKKVLEQAIEETKPPTDAPKYVVKAYSGLLKQSADLKTAPDQTSTKK
jgi:tetratricopeptide (TPR) repeat protein